MSISFLVVGLIAGLYMAWNIGANDVANAMGTSVGSKALTLRRAIIIAIIFEVAGAVLVGSHVTETVRKGIVDVTAFQADPRILGLGMLAALIGAGTWLQVATQLKLPVSTTHSIVGGVMGFGLAAAGMQHIYWGKILTIASSWIIAPLCGGIASFLVFQLIRKTILSAANPRDAARRFIPVLCFPVVVVLTLSFLFKGLKNLNIPISLWSALGIAGATGALVTIIAYPALRLVNRTTDDLTYVENSFKYLQVLSACYMAFAHGANDVANAVGPMAAVMSVALTGTVGATVEVPLWVLGLGGVGIALGLVTWGYKVIETMGSKITDIVPSRGFVAEFAAASTVLVASRLGMPISTTHTIVGAVMGVGLARGMTALNLRVISRILAAWLLEIPAAGLLAAVFYYLLTLAF